MTDSNQLFSQKRIAYRQNGQLVIQFNDLEKELLIRKTDQVEIQQRQKIQEQQFGGSISFIAIYGIISLKQYDYLVVVVKAQYVGSIMNLPIFQAEKFQFIPIENTKISSQDSGYINGLNEIFNTKTFYFSEKYDLTNSLQRYVENKGIRKPQQSYWVNYEYIKVFRLCNPELWIPIFISGLVAIRFCKVSNIECQISLISRRDYRRMGRRFISRGADLDGNCSNFAETEQIFHYQSLYYSFLQSRGSMPFKWIQKPDLKWSPKAKILGDIISNTEIAQKHFNDQFKSGISKHILVNLIDKKGSQLMLGNYFNEVVQRLNNDNLSYIWFDFHHECRGMKYQNLSKLIDQIKQDLTNGEQFCFDLKPGTQQLNAIGVISTQKCIVRTNCVDCLDRTNVVQSVIARHQLWSVLSRIGVNRLHSQAMEPFPGDLEQIFRDIWTINADTISLLYTGTGALKTDSTKKGKRTKMGALQDGYRSITRYFIGNFNDGGIQNNIDLLTNKIDVKKQGYNNSFFKGWHFLFVIFLSAYIGFWKYGGQVIAHPKIQQALGLGLEKKQEPDAFKLSLAHYLLVVSGMAVVRFLVSSKYKIFVRESKLNH